ncbi:uncharacterized protein LOC143484312 [Brachyhypopomus gauderio]|uniref:uncharacterized protein LOC143484312 n=1 Tax=Brachyhypopomus gauderio TaxID=698409 RepID=UPI004041AE81
MPGYKPKPKKGKKPSKRHHRSSSSPPRRITSPTPEQLERDPVCALQLASARRVEESNPELAEIFRQGAMRIWRELHSPPSRARSPPRVDSGVYGAVESTPENEFGEEDSEEEEEQDEEEEAYPPSIGEASTVDYGGDGEEAYPPSLDDVSTVDYGGEEESKEEDYLPPPVGPASIVEEGEEDDDEDYPPSERSAYPSDYGEEEEEDRPLSVHSGVSECTDSKLYSGEDGSPPPSECSAGTVKGSWRPEASPSSERSGEVKMECSWGGSPEQFMERTRSEDEESIETEGVSPSDPYEEYADRAAPGAYADRDAPSAYADRAAPGAYADCAAPGAYADRAAPGTSAAAPAAPGLPPLLALLLARSLAPVTCLCIPVFVSLPVCIPNPFFPFVPLCVNVPVCVFVNVPCNVSNIFSPMFPGRVF